ncbi:hypothetical protein L1987_13635 [Smallanthus sonchifolius]|uniref:Uncharacterized protein n=1 Tax=Smallanthus sonchifolius TaxID=185202 RepID=A0ACB9JJE4_9ASTR|nr:hypothetical protein L1987_13635 [Smallanthus sonchifolius]
MAGRPPMCRNPDENHLRSMFNREKKRNRRNHRKNEQIGQKILVGKTSLAGTLIVAAEKPGFAGEEVDKVGFLPRVVDLDSERSKKEQSVALGLTGTRFSSI